LFAGFSLQTGRYTRLHQKRLSHLCLISGLRYLTTPPKIMSDQSKIFHPLQLGKCALKHRVILSPMTRFRADTGAIPSPLMKEYYTQRASVPGTLIITEATAISEDARGFDKVPGIWNQEQIAAWKTIVDSVHSKDSFIWLQLWATGRAAEPGFNCVSSSSIQIPPQEDPNETYPVPRSLTAIEVKDFIDQYVFAAENAMKCGFDGVEIHGANGFLIDQFTQESCNERTDEWGGSIEKRARFGLEVTKRITSKIGSDRVGVKLSPWSTYLGMGVMKDLILQFEYIIKQLRDTNIAYLHLANSRWVESRSHPDVDNETFVRMWGKQKPIILAGGYDAESARKVVENTYAGHNNITVCFGRHFLSNPDLPFRLRHGIQLTPYNRDTFYGPGAEGYVDYPFSSEFIASH
jgi:2,4-dienoyl-CoA reductase-like NADH-dependent reductase (Old Yellow Enzyme family)